MEKAKAIIDRINNDQLLTPGMFEIDTDAALDYRDTPPFEKPWMAAFHKLPEADIPDDLKSLHEEIRKAAYLKTYHLTESPELAGYVSDDFGLIAASLLLDISDNWVNGLWVEYTRGKFPAEELTSVPGKLSELI